MVDTTSQIRVALEQVVDDLIVDGTPVTDALDEVERELQALRDSYDRDPDPAGDPPDEDGPPPSKGPVDLS